MIGSLSNLGKDIQHHKQKNWSLLYGNIILIDDKVYYLYFPKGIFSEKDFFLIYLVVLFLNNVVFHYIETIFFSYTLYPKYISLPLLLPVLSYIPFLPDTLPLIRKKKLDLER